MKTITHTDLSGFLSNAASTKLDGRKIYRGQRDSGWKLENRWKRFKRDFLNSSKSGADVREKLRATAVSHFRANQFGAEAMSDSEAEALCQHNGLPTRLMDWSLSPYIGLFFAFDVASLLPNGAVSCAVHEIDLPSFQFACCFSIDRDEAAARSEAAKSYAFTSDVNVMTPKILKVADRSNLRANRQEGLFLILPDKYSDLEKFETECMALHPDAEFITKHVIPNTSRIDGIRHLHAMGRSAAATYCEPGMSAIDAAFHTLNEV